LANDFTANRPITQKTSLPHEIAIDKHGGQRIASRERYDLIESGNELLAAAYKDGTGLSLDECCEGCRDLTLGRRVESQ
jgi:hypothetical protein